MVVALLERDAVEHVADAVVFDERVACSNKDPRRLIRDLAAGSLNDQTAEGDSLRGDFHDIAVKLPIDHGPPDTFYSERLIDHDAAQVSTGLDGEGRAGGGGVDHGLEVAGAIGCCDRAGLAGEGERKDEQHDGGGWDRLRGARVGPAFAQEADDRAAECDDQGTGKHQPPAPIDHAFTVEVHDLGASEDLGGEGARIERRLLVQVVAVVVEPVLDVDQEPYNESPRDKHRRPTDEPVLEHRRSEHEGDGPGEKEREQGELEYLVRMDLFHARVVVE